MKLKISLVKSFSDELYSAAVVEDENESIIDVAGGEGFTPKRACLNAAKALREAAARFEALALEENPYHEATHNRINRMKVSA